jgi:hypothetical protein
MGKNVSFNLSRHHKIALIDHLTALSSINTELTLETNVKKRSKLQISQKSHIRAINSLVPFLKSVGKLSDNEVVGLLKLDLVNLKNLRLNFRIGGA